MKDLTILIQGPYFEFEDYNSNKNINLLNKVFPEATILISTWEGEKRFKIKDGYKAIYNKDPGFVHDEHFGSSTPGSNIQRQIESVQNGLKEINTKYTLKIRSDCYFSSDKILNLNTKDFKVIKEHSFFEERIITSSVGSLNQSKTLILYHYSDWFNYGLTKDIKKLWENLKIEEGDIKFFSNFEKEKKNIYGKDWDLKFTAEQIIYFKSISNKINNKIIHAHDFSKKNLGKLKII